MEQFEVEKLKITWLNYWLIKIGIKTLELRAYEKLKDGGTYLFTTPRGKNLAIIALQLEVTHKDLTCFKPVNELYKITPSDIAKSNYYRHLASMWFWKKWITHYQSKEKTPAFYKIIAFTENFKLVTMDK